MTAEPIEGTVDNILFYSPDTGYSVFRFVTDDGQSLTVIGGFPPLSPGERLQIHGTWENNPRFGRQYRMENFFPVLPSSRKGIEKFLSSGLIKGIGPVRAKAILEKFGDMTLDILSRNPDRLREVEGIGPVKLREIKKAWAEHQDIRDLIIFLQEHNISTGLATRIYRHYGKRSYHILKTNPYQACHDIWGIGFKTADQMAMKMGLSPASPERLKAYVVYLLEKDNEQGHVFSNQSDIRKLLKQDLDAGEEQIRSDLDDLEKSKQVVIEDIDGDRAVYLPFFHDIQEKVVKSILDLVAFPVKPPAFDVEKAVADSEDALGLAFSPTQRSAVRECFEQQMLVITGGPGTGKTTIIRTVVDLYLGWGKKVLLAAPTGRAAKRLADATGREAKTLHRTLEYNPKENDFRRHESNPLIGDILIIDEFSMVDLPLMFSVLRAVPPWMRLVLVGDKDQLPSVGPGNMLRDIIESGTVRVVRLTEIFRQEEGSLIVVNAHRVNSGERIVLPEKGDKDSDFYFIHQADEQKAFDMIMTLCRERIPRRFGIDPLSPHIQVISPMYRGLLGVDNLNTELQNRLNPLGEGLKVGQRQIRIKDKVMQVRNNYDKEIFNGDIGTVVDFETRAYRIFVDFDGRVVTYEREDLNEITLAYAVSVHKSQGSEYQAVVLPLYTQHYIMLQRNLFYTALTRAKRLSCIIGTFKALNIAIKNDKPVKRNCLVKDKLIQAASERKHEWPEEVET